MKVIMASHFAPEAVGNGGNHRAYQLWQDAAQTVGPENVVAFRSRPHWWRPLLDEEPDGDARHDRLLARWKRLVRIKRRSWSGYAENPLKRWAHTYFQTNSCLTRRSLQRYKALVRGSDEPAICIIEHPGFGALLPINAKHSIKTIACSQNIESLDALPFKLKRRREFSAVGVDLANEIRVLAACDARLFISRVEIGLIGGLGFTSHYYPYLPVGDIRTRLLEIRESRQSGSRTPGMLLMLGTAAHSTTAASMRWFLEQAAKHGLPPGVTVVVAGLFTDALLPAGQHVPGIQLRGWTDQPELDALVARAQAVVMPHLLGLGAPTRVSEMACAGVPILLSRHATYGIEPPPGTRVLDDDWPIWSQAMLEAVAGLPGLERSRYENWERAQPNPLKRLLDEWTNGSADA
jgi:hypothetical protein